MTPQTETLGHRLEQCRQKAGLSYNDLHLRVYDQLGDHTPTLETIRQYHRGEGASRRPDMLLLAALAEVYDTTVSALAENVFDESISDLLKQRIMGTDAGHRRLEVAVVVAVLIGATLLALTLIVRGLGG